MNVSYDDHLSEVIHESIIRVMGILYMSQLVEGANMGAMMRLFSVGEEVCQQYDDMIVEFDNDFFNDHQKITGIDLRDQGNVTVH
jgi:hypothetical protein